MEVEQTKLFQNFSRTFEDQSKTNHEIVWIQNILVSWPSGQQFLLSELVASV